MSRAILGALTILFAISQTGPSTFAQTGSQAGAPLYMPGIKYDLPAVLVTAADIARMKKQMEEKKETDVPIRMVDCGGDEGGHQVGVSLVCRFKGQKYGAALHDQVSEVYHILEGAGTMIVGGRLTNPKRRANSGGNGPGIAGDGIEAGVRTRVAKGDVLIIPAGTPHQFEPIDDATWYTVVRADPSKVTPLQ